LLQGLGDAQAPVPVLVWLCEPCNPTGESLPATFWPALMAAAAHRPMALAIDRAYEPLRLQGSDPVPLEAAGRMWQCLSPNKSLGLTGVRAGCLLAPEADPLGLRPLIASLAPSWVLSAEGVAMLQALPLPETQAGLAEARPVLAAWAAAQRRMLDGFGWQQRESVTPFWLARPPWPDDQLPRRLARLRGQGIKLRDAASFGLPGWLRLSAQPPASQRALADALNLDWTDRR
jgi:histidinol-phosphate aminotransferase